MVITQQNQPAAVEVQVCLTISSPRAFFLYCVFVCRCRSCSVMPVVKAHQSGRCVGHTRTRNWGTPRPRFGAHQDQELGHTKSWGLPTPGAGAHQDQDLGHTKTKSWGSAVPQEPVSEGGVSKSISYGVIRLQRSFLLQLTKAVTLKNK